MTDIAAPVPAQPLPHHPGADAAAPLAVQAGTSSAPALRSRLRRLTSALAETHRAAVPF